MTNKASFSFLQCICGAGSTFDWYCTLVMLQECSRPSWKMAELHKVAVLILKMFGELS